MTAKLAEKFWDKVDRSGECWIWTGTKNSGGYGSFRNRQAHRWAYQELVGPIPAGLQLDHLCRVRACVNPAHLEPVTQAENIRRGMAPSIVIARSGKCGRGHEMTPENTYLNRNLRFCRACRQDRERAAYHSDAQVREQRLARNRRNRLPSRKTESTCPECGKTDLKSVGVHRAKAHGWRVRGAAS